MPLIYDGAVKTARMNAARTMVAGGTMEIVATNGAVLASFRLTDSGGVVNGSEWTVGYADDRVVASSGGRAASAQFKDSGGNIRISGLTVGMENSNADVKISNTQVNQQQTVSVLGDRIFVHA